MAAANDSLEKPGLAAWVSTRARHRVATLTVRDDALITVCSGRKSLVAPSGVLCVEAGTAVAMPRGTQWDVINDPAGSGRYEAQVLTFSDALICRHATAMTPAAGGPPARELQSARVVVPDEELSGAIGRAASTLGNTQASTALGAHRLVEVLILLAERGIRFRPGGELRWHERVRRLVAQRPHGDWDVGGIADALHVSASTLRRRLDAEARTEAPPAVAPAAHGGVSGVSRIVREVRLETALGLLQTTRLPVGEVAARCGWTSHSRFTQAFQARWGFAPSLLRGEPMRPQAKQTMTQELTQPGEPLAHPG